MPQIRKEVKKHCRLCLQIQGRECICYNHRYFCRKVWTRFSENKSGSFLQWRYCITGPRSKRRKGAVSCTAEANNRRTRQGLKGCVNKRKTHTSIKLPLVWKGSVTLYVEGECVNGNPKNEDHNLHRHDITCRQNTKCSQIPVCT